MRVVRDDERGTVLWLPGETPTAESRICGFEDINPHAVPYDRRFLPPGCEPERVHVASRWRGRGVVRIVPAGSPYSVWVFTGPQKEFRAWYVNLEHRHRLSAPSPQPQRGEPNGHLYTADHILDVVIRAGAEPELKDEDELAGALAGGMYSAEAVRLIRDEAQRALAAFASGHWAFDREWTQWRAPRAWDMTAAQRHQARSLLDPWLGPAGRD